MKPLAYAVWFTALAIFVWGCTIAFRANRMSATLAAAPQIRSNQDPSRAARFATEPAPATAKRDNSPPVARTTEPKQFNRETAEERRVRLTNTMTNTSQISAARDGIRVRLRYHSFYASLGLNPSEIARFEKAMVGKMDPFSNIVGLPPEELARTQQSLARTMDQVVRDTLGEEAVPKMREFIATADLREVADKLAANTFHTDTPLNAQQAERFVQTCMDCRTQPGDGIRNLPDAVDWEKALRQAESFLTPTQLSVLRTMTDMRRFDQVFKQSTGLTYRPPVRNF